MPEAKAISSTTFKSRRSARSVVCGLTARPPSITATERAAAGKFGDFIQAGQPDDRKRSQRDPGQQPGLPQHGAAVQGAVRRLRFVRRMRLIRPSGKVPRGLAQHPRLRTGIPGRQHRHEIDGHDDRRNRQQEHDDQPAGLSAGVILLVEKIHCHDGSLPSTIVGRGDSPAPRVSTPVA